MLKAKEGNAGESFSGRRCGDFLKNESKLIDFLQLQCTSAGREAHLLQPREKLVHVPLEELLSDGAHDHRHHLRPPGTEWRHGCVAFGKVTNTQSAVRKWSGRSTATFGGISPHGAENRGGDNCPIPREAKSESHEQQSGDFCPKTVHLSPKCALLWKGRGKATHVWFYPSLVHRKTAVTAQRRKTSSSPRLSRCLASQTCHIVCHRR